MKTSKKKSDIKNRIITKQVDEIESLKEKISKLEIDCKDKDELIKSIESYRNQIQTIVKELEEKKEDYEALNHDLMQMRKVFNQEVFKGRWRIIKWLMR